PRETTGAVAHPEWRAVLLSRSDELPPGQLRKLRSESRHQRFGKRLYCPPTRRESRGPQSPEQSPLSNRRAIPARRLRKLPSPRPPTRLLAKTREHTRRAQMV